MEIEYKKQISNDSLLRTHEEHQITCPIINALKFNGESSSKIYEIRLDYDPIELKIDVENLLKSTDDLDKWANSILKLHNELPYTIKEILKNKADIDMINNLIHESYNERLKEYKTDINGLIDQWIDYRSDLKDLKDLENSEINDLEECEKKLLLKKMKNESTADTEELIDFHKNEILNIKEKQEDVYGYFDRYIKEEFEQLTTTFSNELEIIRNRNDDLRSEVGELRYYIIKHCRDLLELYQPDEYLDNKYGITKDTVNLGIFYNTSKANERNEDKHFNGLIIGLKVKKYITFDQMNFLLDIKSEDYEELKYKRKTELFKCFKENGIKKVRYYKNQKDYIENKNNFKEKDLQKLKQKITP